MCGLVQSTVILVCISFMGFVYMYREQTVYLKSKCFKKGTKIGSFLSRKCAHDDFEAIYLPFCLKVRTYHIMFVFSSHYE